MKTDVTYLNVPYNQKETVKSLGAKWDPEEKKWFAPKGVTLEDFEQWIKDEDDLEN